MNVTVEHFEFAAGLSEPMLLQTVAELSRARNLPAMESFLDFLESSASKTQPVFADNLALELSLKQRPEDNPKGIDHGIFKDTIPPSEILLAALMPLNRKFVAENGDLSREPDVQDVQRLSAAEESYLWRLARMADAMPKAEWIDDLGLSLVQRVNDPAVIAKFTDEFSLTTEARRTYMHYTNHRRGNETSLAEQALLRGNLAIVPQLIDLLDKDGVAQMLKQFQYEAAEQNSNLSLMNQAMRTQPDSAVRIVEAIERKIGAEEGAELRMRVMEGHMRLSIQNNHAVNAKALVDLVGPTQEHRDAFDLLGRIHTGKNFAMAVIESHTYELLPFLREAVSLKKGEESSRAQAGIQSAINDRSRTLHSQHDADRMAKTIEFLIGEGQQIGVTGENQSALRWLAKVKDTTDKLEKLVVLLGFGDDPAKPDFQGKIPSQHLKAAERKAWNNVCNSFAARKTAHSVLDDIENEMKPSKVAP